MQKSGRGLDDLLLRQRDAVLTTAHLFDLPRTKKPRMGEIYFPEYYNPKVYLDAAHFTKNTFQNNDAGYTKKLLQKWGQFPLMEGRDIS